MVISLVPGKTLLYRRQLQHETIDVGGTATTLWKRLVLFQNLNRNVIMNDHSTMGSQNEPDESPLDTSQDALL